MYVKIFKVCHIIFDFFPISSPAPTIPVLQIIFQRLDFNKLTLDYYTY